jgi:hypothetical protein
LEKFVDQKGRDLLNIAAVDPYGTVMGSSTGAAQELKKLSTEGAKKDVEVKLAVMEGVTDP